MITQLEFYETCPVTGFTDIEISFDAGRGQVSERRSFTSENNAQAYVYDVARSAILVRIEKYIRTVKGYAHNDTGYYKTIRKGEDLKWLWGILPELNKKSLVDICKNLYHFKDKIYGILPGEQRPYYKSLRENALDIVAFAKVNREFNIENMLPEKVVAA